MIPDEPIPRTNPLKTWGIRLLKIGITALALWLSWRVVAGLQWADLEARVVHASPFFLIAGLFFLTARWLFWDWRFRLASAHVLERAPGPGTGFLVLLASAALNLITPSARLIGGLMRARYFARSVSRSFGLLYGVVLYDQVAHHTVMSTWTWIALIAAAFALKRAGLGFAALAALVAAAALLWLWSRRGRSFEDNPLVRFLARRAERSEGRMQQLFAHGHEAVGVFVRLLGERRLAAQAIALGTGFFLCNAFAQWVVFLALGLHVDPLVILAGVSLGNAAGILTGAPGGAGTTEAAMVASFVAMGVGRVDAVAATLLFRGLHYVIVLGIGLPALATLELRLNKTPGEIS
jgi:uncharacterized protein (TIRG00374 family)